MSRLLVALLVATLASCSLVPNASVRVALPEDPEIRALWEAAMGALPPGGPRVELVSPGAFPPADLVWSDGRALWPAPGDRALAANGQVEALGLQAGLARQWFAVDGLRLLPLALEGQRPWGLWWNQEGWNPEAAVSLLARLWSPQAQAVWSRRPGLRAVNSGVFPSPGTPELRAAP